MTDVFQCPFQKRFLSQLTHDDEFYMQLAYNQAIDAWRRDEVPIGAVVVYKGNVIAAEHNRVESIVDPTAHAEMLAITQASRWLGDWRLNGATLYVTKEPCLMCAGAALIARLDRLVYAIADPHMGCLGGACDLNRLPQLLQHMQVDDGILESECRQLLQAFFQKKRAKN